jgi:shikimate dehydrogenase
MPSANTPLHPTPLSTKLNGKTHVYGVIGNPISHTFSPEIQNTIAAAMGHDNVYVPFHVLEPNLEAAVRGAAALGIAGLNVTIPHKREVMRFCTPDAAALAVGAVNTLKLTPDGFAGYNTDCAGINRSFDRRGVSLAGKTVAIIGAGGSAYAACVACCHRPEAMPARLYIINRTIENADNLAKHVNKYYNTDIAVLSLQDAAKAKADIAIQTTSQGFGAQAGGTPIADPRFFEGLQAALDIIYTPWETVFMREAARAGHTIVMNGFDMLVYQAVAAYEIWNETSVGEARTEHIRAELERFYRMTPR